MACREESSSRIRGLTERKSEESAARQVGRMDGEEG